MKSLHLSVFVLAATGIFAPMAHAAPTTSKGQVSVAQVVEMAQRSATDDAARNAIVAYLAGVGEASGLLFAEGRNHGSTFNCSKTITLSQELAVAALSAAAPDRASWAETPATPIIVADMFARGACQ